MEHVIVRISDTKIPTGWVATSRDGYLLDLDVLEHESSFLLAALHTKLGGKVGYLPVQQPLMLESFLCHPELSATQTAQTLTRLTEYAIGEAFRRDAGEIYFLTRDEDTAKFAERHKFKPLPDGLKVYRLNLRETFGIS